MKYKTGDLVMKLFLDDIRNPPHFSWMVFRTAPEMIRFLEKNLERVKIISLDHDLGEPKNGTGYDVVLFLEEIAYTTTRKIPELRIHSANPVGRKRMQMGIDNIKRMR